MSVRTLLLGILRVGGASARVYIAHKTNTPGRCVVVFDCKLFVHAECTGRACKGGGHGRHLADLLGGALFESASVWGFARAWVYPGGLALQGISQQVNRAF